MRRLEIFKIRYVVSIRSVRNYAVNEGVCCVVHVLNDCRASIDCYSQICRITVAGRFIEACEASQATVVS